MESGSEDNQQGRNDEEAKDLHSEQECPPSPAHSPLASRRHRRSKKHTGSSLSLSLSLPLPSEPLDSTDDGVSRQTGLRQEGKEETEDTEEKGVEEDNEEKEDKESEKDDGGDGGAGDMDEAVTTDGKEEAAEPAKAEPVEDDALLQKYRAHREKVLGEIIDTERTYMKSLGKLIEVFLKPLKTQNIVDSSTIPRLFSNIESLQRFHLELYMLFEAAMKQVKKATDHPNHDRGIGNIFLSRMPFFKLYTEYVNNYDVSHSTLMKLNRDKKFTTFVTENCISEDGKQVGSFYLKNLLITPIQRIPRYQMLLQDIVKHTPRSHPDFDEVMLAQMKMKEIADFMENKKNQVEGMSKLKEVQSRLRLVLSKREMPEIVRPGRSFIREYSCQTSLPKMKDCTLYLFNDSLLLTTSCKIDKKEFRKSVQSIGPESLFYVLLPLRRIKIEPHSDWAADSKYFFSISCDTDTLASLDGSTIRLAKPSSTPSRLVVTGAYNLSDDSSDARRGRFMTSPDLPRDRVGSGMANVGESPSPSHKRISISSFLRKMPSHSRGLSADKPKDAMNLSTAELRAQAAASVNQDQKGSPGQMSHRASDSSPKDPRRHRESVTSATPPPVVHADEAASLPARAAVVMSLETLEGKQEFMTSITRLLDDISNMKKTNKKGITPLPALHLACKEGNLGTVKKKLREEHVDPDSKDVKGRVALHLAVKHQHGDIVRLLLENGADPEVPDLRGTTPVDYAYNVGDDDVIVMLTDMVEIRKIHAAQLAAVKGKKKK